MSIEFIDGFDHYNNITNLQRKWTSSSQANFVAGRFGGNAMYPWPQSQPVALGGLSNQATRVIGFALYIPSISVGTPSGVGNIIFNFMDGSTIQVSLGFSNGYFVVSRGGSTVLGTMSTPATGNQWVYVELSVTINSTTGAYNLRMAGTSVLSGSSVNTQNSGNAYTNGIQFPNALNSWYFDDLYLLNSLGTVNNTFLGECQIFTSLPSGDDASNKQWTPSAGTNHYANVSDNPPDDDTTYNSSGTVAQIDLFTFPSITPSGAIVCVQDVITARKDSTGPRTISDQCKSGATIFTGSSAFSPGSVYGMFMQIREQDPNTSAAWTLTNLNAAEFGIKLAS